MGHTHSSVKKGYFWQGLLILLPMAALALACLNSIRQDRILVEQEARTQAARFAEEINRNVSAAISSLNTDPERDPRANAERAVLKLDAAGGMVQPPPLPSAPLPCLVTNLPPRQAALRNEALQSEFLLEDPEKAASAWQALIDEAPGANIMAEALYRRGLMQMTANPEGAGQAWLRIISKYPGAMLESGLSAGTMARLQWIRLFAASNAPPDSPGLDALCQDAVQQPAFLTPLILDEALNLHLKKGLLLTNDWKTVWQQHERLRGMHRRAAAEIQAEIRRMSGQPSKDPCYFWILTDGSPETTGSPHRGAATSSDMKQLARLTADNGGGWNLRLLSNADLQRALDPIVGPVFRASPHLGIIVELAGTEVLLCRCDLEKKPSSTNPGQTENLNGRILAWHRPLNKEMTGEMAARLSRSFAEAPLLASAESPSAGAKFAATRIFLSCPSILYEAQSARSLRFGLLVAAALAIAFAGLYSAWRAFTKQARLIEMKSNFVSSVSHEMRSPIASIRLMAEGLESGRVRDEQKVKEYFHFIVQECRRMAGLVENVLDFSRIDQGRLKLEWQVVDLAELAQRILAILTPLAAERQVSLNLITTPSPASNGAFTATADERAMQQVLVNLIDNAIKHSKPGGAVEIGIESIEAPMNTAGKAPLSNRICIWVQDHGDGIPLADQSHIFEPFFRSGSELRRRTQGTGLGLAIVKHLVEAHQGTVSFQSAPVRGACFRIELP